MSYEIVFKTLAVERNDKIYLFSRIGCNNDDMGRKDDDFIVEIYDSKELALKDIEKRFKGCYEAELKLNGKFVNYDYYYNYLKKKIDKPLSIETFDRDYNYYFKELVDITCFTNGKSYTPEEYNKVWRDLLYQYNKLSSRYNFKEIGFDDLVNTYNGQSNIGIYIRKRKVVKGKR